MLLEDQLYRALLPSYRTLMIIEGAIAPR